MLTPCLTWLADRAGSSYRGFDNQNRVLGILGVYYTIVVNSIGND